MSSSHHHNHNHNHHQHNQQMCAGSADCSDDEFGFVSPSYFALLCANGAHSAISIELVDGILQCRDVTARLSLLKALLCAGWVNSKSSTANTSPFELDHAFQSLSQLEFSIRKRSHCIQYIENCFHQLEERFSNGKRICGNVWGPHEPGYRCHTCEISQFACLCVNCFNLGNHYLHDYTVFHSPVGGVCDCGDEVAFRSHSSFCSDHSVVEPRNRRDSQESELRVALTTIRPIMNVLMERILWNLRIMNFFDLNEHESASIELGQRYVSARYAGEFGHIPSWYPSDFADKFKLSGDGGVHHQLQHIIDRYLVRFQSLQPSLAIQSSLEMHDVLLSFLIRLLRSGTSITRTVLEVMNEKTVESFVPNLLLDRLLRATGPLTISVGESHLCRSLLNEFMFWCCITRYQNGLKLFLIALAIDQCNKKLLMNEYIASYPLASRILHTSHDLAMMNRMIHFSVAIYCDDSHIKQTEIHAQMLGALLGSLWLSAVECDSALVPCQVRYDNQPQQQLTHYVLNHSHPLVDLYLSWQASTEIMIGVCHKTAAEVFISQPRLFGMWLDVVARLQGIFYLFENQDTSTENLESKVSMTELHVSGSILGSVVRTIQRNVSDEQVEAFDEAFSKRSENMSDLSQSAVVGNNVGPKESVFPEVQRCLFNQNPINPLCLISNVLQILTNLGSWFNNIGLTCNLMNSNNVLARLANENLDQALTFHLPLHRILSNFLFVLINRFNISARQIFNVIHTQVQSATRLLELILAHPVQLQYAVVQSQANPALNHKFGRSALLYMCTKSFAGSPSIDRDRFLIRALCSHLSPDTLMFTVLRRFRIYTDYFEKPELLLKYLNGSADENVIFSNRTHCELVEGLVYFIAQLITIPYSLDPTNPDVLTKEAIAILSINDRAFSQIEDSLPAYTRNSRCRTILRKVLDSIANYVPPSILGRKPKCGYYTLKDEYRDFDPLFTNFRSVLRPEWYLSAMSNFVKWIEKSTSMTGEILQKLWPPLKTHLNEECVVLLHSRLLHQLILLLLRSYLRCGEKIGEPILCICVFLLRMALLTSFSAVQPIQSLNEKSAGPDEQNSLRCVYERNDIRSNILARIDDQKFRDFDQPGGPCDTKSPCDRCRFISTETSIDCLTIVVKNSNSVKDAQTQTCCRSRSTVCSAGTGGKSILGLLIEILARDSRLMAGKSNRLLSEKARVLELLKNERLTQNEFGALIGTEVSHICDLLAIIAGIENGQATIDEYVNGLSEVVSVIERPLSGIKEQIKRDYSKKKSLFMKFSKESCADHGTELAEGPCCVICRDNTEDLPFGLIGLRQKTDLASRQFVSVSKNEGTGDLGDDRISFKRLSDDAKSKIVEFLELRTRNVLIGLRKANEQDLEVVINPLEALEKMKDVPIEVLGGGDDVATTMAVGKRSQVELVEEKEAIIAPVEQPAAICDIFDLFPNAQCRRQLNESPADSVAVIDESVPFSLADFGVNVNAAAADLDDYEDEDENWCGGVISETPGFFADHANSSFVNYTFFKSCGHHIHLQCARHYISRLDSSNSKFECPVCRRACNTVIPLAGTISRSSISELNDFIDRNLSIGPTKSHHKELQMLRLLRSQLESEMIADSKTGELYNYGGVLAELVCLCRSSISTISRHVSYIRSALEAESFSRDPFVPILFYDSLNLMLNLIIYADDSAIEAFYANVQSVYDLSLAQSMIAITLAGNKVDSDDEISECMCAVQQVLANYTFEIAAAAHSNKNPIDLRFVMETLEIKIVRSLAFLKLSLSIGEISEKDKLYVKALISDSQQTTEQAHLSVVYAELCDWIGVSRPWNPLTIRSKAEFWVGQLFENVAEHERNRISAYVASVANFQGFACRTLKKPSLMPLPSRINSLHCDLSRFVCSNCERTPFANHLKWKSNVARICLLCSAPYVEHGELDKLSCCSKMNEISSAHRNGRCGGDVGISMLLRNSVVSISVLEHDDDDQDGTTNDWGALYLDENGEEDLELSRGRPLVLNEERFRFLENEWRNLTAKIIIMNSSHSQNDE